MKRMIELEDENRRLRIAAIYKISMLVVKTCSYEYWRWNSPRLNPHLLYAT